MIESAILNDKKRRLDYAIGIVIGHLIAEAINEINLALDSNKSRWITIHPNGKKHKGRACKIDLETGQIKGGNLPQRFFNKPLNEAFKSNKEVHHFSLQSEPLVTKSNVRASLSPRNLTPAKLKAATIQGRQILKANPLPECFATQKQGVQHIQTLLPYTALYLDLFSKESLHCIASALHIAAEDFPHILTTSVYELGHFDHKYNEFIKQEPKRMAIEKQLNNDKEWQCKTLTKLNAKISKIKTVLEQLPDNEKFPYLCRIATTVGKSKDWVENSIKNGVFFKDFSKLFIKISRTKELKLRLEQAGLITNCQYPQKLVSALFNPCSKEISLNSKHFYHLGNLFLLNEYEKSVSLGRLSKLKPGINIKTAIVLHELMHALDYSYSLNAKSLSDLKYFDELFDKAKTEEYNQTNHKFDNIHEFFADSMVEYYLCEKRNQSAISVHAKVKELFILH